MNACTTNTELLTDNVQRGIDLLDSLGYNLKWRTAALTPNFDMGTPNECILARVFGGFHTGYYMLGWGYDPDTGGYHFDKVVSHGFFSYDRREYAFLTEAWTLAGRLYTGFSYSEMLKHR